MYVLTIYLADSSRIESFRTLRYASARADYLKSTGLTCDIHTHDPDAVKAKARQMQAAADDFMAEFGA